MDFVAIAAIIALGLLVWDCVEVGRNDAANLVNAVFGARVMKRKRAVLLAGLFVILGATFSSPVMETVRKGIFDLPSLSAEMAVTVFLSAYIVDTLLLYSYSSFGMPVSTTATLVFCLAGAAIGVTGSVDVVSWSTLGKVVFAIVISIVISGVAAFMVQRIFRGSVRHKVGNHFVMTLHGPWITGAIMTFLTWFMVVKGLKGVPAVRTFRDALFDVYSVPGVLLIYWAILTLITHLIVTGLGRVATRNLFPFTALVGMCALAFAFGQNDLANAASPGLSALWIWKSGVQPDVAIPRWALFACGILIFLGMTTKRAQRVTRAEVNTASQYDQVALWAPEWTRKLARVFLRSREGEVVLAPAPKLTPEGKRIHYDTLRASVIMAVSASVIAFASSMGIPVSTTYVGFAAVVTTGMADRVYGRGEADVKVGRAIWVVFCWFLGAALAFTGCAVVAFSVNQAGLWGIAGALGTNLGLRYYFKRRSDRHEYQYHGRFEGQTTGEGDDLKRESASVD